MRVRMRRLYCIYYILNNTHLERLVLKWCVFMCVCDRAVPAQRVVLWPEQNRITSFYYQHLCLLCESDKHKPFPLLFPHLCICTRASETWTTQHCKNYSTQRLISWELIAAFRTGPCPLRCLLPPMGLGLPKT